MIKINNQLSFLYYTKKHLFKSFFTIVFTIMMLLGLSFVIKNATIELDYTFFGEKIRIALEKQENKTVYKYFHNKRWHQINSKNKKSISFVYYSPHFNKYFINEPTITLFVFRIVGAVFFLLISLRSIKLLRDGKNLDSLFNSSNIHLNKKSLLSDKKTTKYNF